MRVNAYIMAADPAWIEASITSYYDLVTNIIVSYDESSTGWTGVPISVNECCRRLRAIDPAGKLIYCGGQFARLERTPLENDTYQRQVALDLASKGADWVIQLDTDEVLANPETFLSSLEEAAKSGFDGLEYPARWLYRQVSPGRFLETCSRFWGVAASYPGPVAVRAGTRLKLCRQSDVKNFRVDFLAKSTSAFHSKNAPVHKTINLTEAIIHYAWVREPEEMAKKSKSSSHANDFSWSSFLKHWTWSGRHPFLATLITPLQPNIHTRRLRIARII